MINASPRFTGIFIPVEILEMEDLSPLEQMLLSWVDALYCKNHGGCFASNIYLAERLRIKENTLAKLLTKLRKLGLIEDVSFDGRRRIIRAKIGEQVEKSQSNPDLDYDPTQGWTKIQPSVGQPSNPHLYIYNKGDNKEVYSPPNPRRGERASARKTSSFSPKDKTSKPPINRKKRKSQKEPKEEVMSQPAKAGMRLATLLFENIKKIDPKFKIPKLETWAEDIRKLIEIDGREESEVEAVIEWIAQDDFWCKAVLSGRKLRKQFSQLVVNMQKQKVDPKKVENDNQKKKMALVDRNKAWAKSFFKQKRYQNGKNYIEIKENGVEVCFNGGYLIIGFLENGFADQVQSIYRKIGV